MDMKRGAVLAAIVVLLFPHSAPAAPGVETTQGADAIWLIPTQKEGRFIAYYASVMLDEPSGGRFAWDDAAIGKGRCTIEETDFGSMTSCGFTGLVHGKASKTFTMDSSLSSAELVLRGGGKTHRVAWEGTMTIGTYQSWEGCSSSDGYEGEGQGGGASRLAIATGQVLGKQLVTEDESDANLTKGAMVTECAGFGELSTLRPGETHRLSFRS
jgi:hypothetical protein